MPLILIRSPSLIRQIGWWLAHLPHTFHRCVAAGLGSDAQLIVDVGCGDGYTSRLLQALRGRVKEERWIGIDSHWASLQRAKEEESHSAYICADVRALPLRTEGVDAALCLEVIEHLEIDGGLRLLSEVRRIARRQVVLSTPGRFFSQGEFDGNPKQRHHSEWTAKVFRSNGFDVIGVGLADLYIRDGKRVHEGAAEAIVFLLSNLLWFLPYRRPELGATLIACWQRKLPEIGLIGSFTIAGGNSD